MMGDPNDPRGMSDLELRARTRASVARCATLIEEAAAPHGCDSMWNAAAPVRSLMTAAFAAELALRNRARLDGLRETVRALIWTAGGLILAAAAVIVAVLR